MRNEALNFFKIMDMSGKQMPYQTTVVGARFVEEKYIATYTLGIFEESTRDRLSKFVKALIRVQVLPRGQGLGDENDKKYNPGYLHMTMYGISGEQDQIFQEMVRLAQARPVVSFSSIVWNEKRTGSVIGRTKEAAMNKISFSKVGINEYRQHLSSLSLEGLAEVFTFGLKDENIDEIGERVSAADLAMDEVAIRSGLVYNLSDDEYGQNMKRIASARGIVPDTDEDLFR
jgi:hypothetical protein